MVLTGSAAENKALEALRAELAQIMAGGPVPETSAGTPADGAIAAEADSDANPEPSKKAKTAGDSRRKAGSSRSDYQPTIRELPAGERPRERLRAHGPRLLNNAELVAILLGSGMAGENAISMGLRVLTEFEGLGGLARADYRELQAQRGLNDAKSCQIMAAFELGRRIASLAPEERAQIGCPQDAANLLIAEMSALTQEHLVTLLLNTRNQVLARRTIYVGTVNSSAVRAAEVLRPAVRANAPALIVAHNHPSGDPTPSPEDIAVTRRLVSAAKLLDIDLLDHIIIGDGGRFASLKEKGLGFD